MRNANVQRALSCGFTAGGARFEHRHNCGPNALRSGTVHEYPIVCQPPRHITIDRVEQIAGVDNALFLIGDVEGYRMGRNFMIEIPRNAINFTGNNFPSYLLLKDGNMHTLGFSTANIESCLRRNAHMFGRDGIVRTNRDLDLLGQGELAPQDWNVETETKHCRPKRYAVETVISNASLNDSSTTVRIDIYECGQIVPGMTEIWYLIRIDCETGDTCKGGNLAQWDDNSRQCGGFINIPGRSTDNGTFVVANFPSGRCGCAGHGHGHGAFNIGLGGRW